MKLGAAAVWRSLFLSLVGANCAACTHLQTNPTGEVPSVAAGQSSRAGAQRGISYQLPMVQYSLKITYALETCPADSPPVFTTKVEAQERYVAGERFEVDYQAMSSIFKTTEFGMTLHDSGTLRTINAEAHDQTGTVLTNVARIGLAVAGLPSGGSSFAVSQSVRDTLSSNPNFLGVEGAPGASLSLALRCTADAVDKLAKLGTETETVKRLTREIEGFTARITRLGAIASLEVMTDDDRAELSRTVRSLMIAEDSLRVANTAIAALQADLSASQEDVWPRHAGDLSSHTGMIAPTLPSLQKLFRLVDVQLTEGDGVRHAPAAADRTEAQSRALEAIPVKCGTEHDMAAIDCLSVLTTISVALVATVTQTQSPTRTSRMSLNDAIIPPTDSRWAQGIFIREPVEARLVVCRAQTQVSGMGCSDQRAPILLDDPVIAPQLGRLRLLTFRSRPFENNHLKLSVRANGFIEEFSYGEESSAAAATGAFADIAERNLAAQEARETERRSDIQYVRDSQAYLRTEAAANRAEQLAELTHQVDLLKRESERLTAQATLENTPSSIQSGAAQAQINGEIAMLQAQIARLRAAAELAAAQSPAQQ